MTSEHGKLLVTAGLAGALLGQACARRQHGEVEPATGERRSSPEVAEDDRSRCAHEGRSDREVEETASARAARPNIRRVYAIVGQGEDAHRVLVKMPPGRGQLDLARAAHKQRDTERVLERGDLPAERRLGDVQLGGGTAEMQRVGQRHEVAQLAKLDRHRYALSIN